MKRKTPVIAGVSFLSIACAVWGVLTWGIPVVIQAADKVEQIGENTGHLEELHDVVVAQEAMIEEVVDWVEHEEFLKRLDRCMAGGKPYKICRDEVE